MSDVLLLLYLGAGCSALAFVLCGYGLARLEATQGAICGNLKPLVGVGLAMGLLGESLTPGQLGGGLLVLIGVGLASGGAVLPWPAAASGARQPRRPYRHGKPTAAGSWP